MNVLKSVYGTDVLNNKIDKLDKNEFVDLCSNIQNGIPATPVLIVKEKDVTDMLELSKLPNLGKLFYG